MHKLVIGIGLLLGMVLAGCTGGGGDSGLAAPVIALQPADATVPSGQTASFTVVATASPAPSYQWRRNGQEIAGATSATYVTPAVALADGGALYTVAVTNNQGAAVSNNAMLGVTAVTSAEKRSLIDLMLLPAELYLAALAPFELMDENDTIVEPTTVCLTGVGAAMINGVPALVGQKVADSGTFSATYNACVLADGTSFDGTTSVVYDFPDPVTWDGNATFTMTNMRRTTRSGGVVDRDYTVNGIGGLVVIESSTPTEDSIRFIAAPTAGATLRNEMDGLTATFTAGAMDMVTGVDAANNVRLNYAWNNLGNTIAGVTYVADGFYELTIDAQGALSLATGTVNFTADGVPIGRVYATAQGGLLIEVDGVSQPLKAPAGISRR
jgi:hypothetical protein